MGKHAEIQHFSKKYWKNRYLPTKNQGKILKKYWKILKNTEKYWKILENRYLPTKNQGK